MPKSKGRKKLDKKTIQPQRQKEFQPWWLGHWKRVAVFVGPIIAFVGLASSVATFLPHLTIKFAGPIDPSSPYPISFKITNTGIIPLSQIQPELGICELTWGEPKDLPERCPKLATYFVFAPWFAKSLAPSEPYTINLEEFLNIKGGQFGAADISIKVDHCPWFLRFWPFCSAKEYRFQTKLGSDGKLWWKSRPVDK